MNAKQRVATNKAIKALGGLSRAAQKYGISTQAVQNWRLRGVPPRRVKQIEKDSGVRREELLPDLYA
jgi:DNA-binding transcriptional regulator YdaS (Cro superfamily)